MEKGKFGSLGIKQGDMSPHVEDMQSSEAQFPERGFEKTTQYIERQDKHRMAASSDIKRQHYAGRYS